MLSGISQRLAVMPAGAIEDQQGVSRSADLAANLAQMVVHCDGIADWHDDRGRFTLAWADRPKHIGRGEAEIFGGCGPAAGLAGAKADTDIPVDLAVEHRYARASGHQRAPERGSE